jgi:hypothetical protein
VSIDNEKVPLLGVAASAIILLVAVGVGQVGKRHRSYGYALGSVALIIAVLGLLPKISDHFDKYSLYVNYFLFLWCFIGACVMTFGDGPFIDTGNGYFSAWALAVFSAMSMGISNTNIPDEVRTATAGMNVILGLGACAFVVMIAIIPYFDNYGNYGKGESIFALVVAVLTIFLALYLVYAKYKNNVAMKQFEFPTLAVFAVLWIVAASMVTFRYPFVTTGNGYFASWGGAVCAVMAAVNSKNENKSSDDETTV